MSWSPMEPVERGRAGIAITAGANMTVVDTSTSDRSKTQSSHSEVLAQHSSRGLERTGCGHTQAPTLCAPPVPRIHQVAIWKDTPLLYNARPR
jgi:hypothetical protein